MTNYDSKKVEEKWRSVWEKTGIYNTDFSSDKPKHYDLVMFPYPSGSFLHIGHVYSYTGGDVYARYKRLGGFNVFEPIGYDAFGLPAENFAIKNNIHPSKSTKENIEHAEAQLKNFGCMFDWKHKVNTSDPDYYRWTQWLFLKLFEKGLAYQKESPVNWCPGCKTVLANEQVIAGACERCDSVVEQKYMKQWFFRITKYADILDKDLDKVDWPKSSVVKQRNWIGRSEGTEISFVGVKEENIDGTITEKEFDINVFTTRPDTLFGATYLVLAPEHPLVDEITTREKTDEVIAYKKATKKKNELERVSEDKEKTGVFVGSSTINPINGEKIPVWIADYVMMGYGTGAIMAVPAHDQRDFEFAKKFGLEIREVISPTTQSESIDAELKAYVGPGILLNSGEYNGLTSEDAKIKITDFLEVINKGKRTTNYRLRDWSFGRQRYWGAPIPIVYCDKCASTGSAQVGIVPVPEKDLPVLLPELDIKDVKPSGTGKGPLANIPEFVKTKCPKCGGDAQRETDTMDTFVDSSFYFLRYPSVGTEIPKLVDAKHPPRKGKKIVPRKAIQAIVVNPKDGKVLCLKWKKFPWTTFITGGVDDGEDIVEAAKREVKEETGYKNLKYIRTLGGPVETHFYAEHKDVNCIAYFTALVFELENDEKGEVSKEERETHDIDWMTWDEIEKDPNLNCTEYPIWKSRFQNEGEIEKSDEQMMDPEITKKWLPVDMYTGGAEHVTMHLLYARFITKALHDAKLIDFDEPFLKLRHQGMILGPDGKKMSKSKGNVVVPDETIKKHGADVFRTYLLFMGPFEDGGPWNPEGMKGVKRFLDKVWDLSQEIAKVKKVENPEDIIYSSQEIEETAIARITHKTVKKVTEDIEDFKFNTAISSMMECVNELIKIKEKLSVESSSFIWRKAIENLTVLVSPFAPHLAEEIWEGLGFKESIVLASWPSYDKELIKEDTVMIPVQVNGKVRDEILIDINSGEEDVKKQAYDSEKVKKYIEGKEIVKTVFVSGKLISIVVKG